MWRIFDGLWKAVFALVVLAAVLMFLFFGIRACSSEPENVEPISVKDVSLDEKVKRAVESGCGDDPICQEVAYGLILVETHGLRKTEIPHLRSKLLLAFYFNIPSWQGDRVIFPLEREREFMLLAYGLKKLYEQLQRWDLVLFAYWSGDPMQVGVCFYGMNQEAPIESWINENRGRFGRLPCARSEGNWLGADGYLQLVGFCPTIGRIGRTYKARIDQAFP